MLTGKELGAAIEAARIAKGVTKKQLADAFGVKPPSIQGWVNTGRIDKAKLMELIAYFSGTVGPEHWGITDRVSVAISSKQREPRPHLAVTDRITSLVLARNPGMDDRGVKRAIANACGISYEAVRQWYAGDTGNIKNENLVAVAEKFDTTVDWLLSGDGAPPRREHPEPARHGQAESNQEGSEPRIRKYQDAKYEKATPEHRHAVDELADRMLGMSEEQALKLKQAMDLLMPQHDRPKD